MSEYTTPGWRGNTVVGALGLIAALAVVMIMVLVKDRRETKRESEAAHRAAVAAETEKPVRIEQVWRQGELRVFRDTVTGCEYLMARTSSHVYNGNDVDVAITSLLGTCSDRSAPPSDESKQP